LRARSIALKASAIKRHLKDFGVASKHGEVPLMTEVGKGNLDFRTLVADAERGGCQWFIVEQDITPADPFDSLERSFRYVHDELVEPAATGAHP
jgi:hypothetical protein